MTSSTASRMNVWPVRQAHHANQNYPGAMPDKDEEIIRTMVGQCRVRREIKKAKETLADLELLERQLINRLEELI